MCTTSPPGPTPRRFSKWRLDQPRPRVSSTIFKMARHFEKWRRKERPKVASIAILLASIDGIEYLKSLARDLRLYRLCSISAFHYSNFFLFSHREEWRIRLVQKYNVRFKVFNSKPFQKCIVFYAQTGVIVGTDLPCYFSLRAI